ncbi:hypothetical protein D3C71_85180 [compost metagenome]
MYSIFRKSILITGIKCPFFVPNAIPVYVAFIFAHYPHIVNYFIRPFVRTK